jgi:penicillin amidase
MNSWTIHDGTRVTNEWQGYYAFEMNPRCIDPEHGYIYSANDWPDDLLKYSPDTNHTPQQYPGYYKPQYRADRIKALLQPENEWNLEKIKTLINDCKSEVDESILKSWLAILESSTLKNNPRFTQLKPLLTWDGEYNPDLVAPAIYNRMLYHSTRLAMEDEMGANLFSLFLTTHQFQRTIKVLHENSTSIWWDNVQTPTRETQAEVLAMAFEKTYNELSESLGSNPKHWTWNQCASLELKHPLGEVALFRPIFNIGKREIWGGNETIHQSGFYLDSTSYAKVFFGSQMRTIVDFADVENGLNITPSGQSGHVMSPHYDDQAELYAQRSFRRQTLQINKAWRKLILSNEE